MTWDSREWQATATYEDQFCPAPRGASQGDTPDGDARCDCENNALTEGRDRTRIVKTPNTVPNGMNRHSMPPITVQNRCRFRLCRARPAAKVNPAKSHPSETRCPPRGGMSSWLEIGPSWGKRRPRRPCRRGRSHRSRLRMHLSRCQSRAQRRRQFPFTPFFMRLPCKLPCAHRDGGDPSGQTLPVVGSADWRSFGISEWKTTPRGPDSRLVAWPRSGAQNGDFSASGSAPRSRGRLVGPGCLLR